jgi:hypothetical protein
VKNIKQLVEIKKVFAEIWQVYITMLKVMVPTIIIVKILDTFGATEVLAKVLAPIMQFVGLPEQMGIVWATAMLTNIYTTMVVFVDVSEKLSLTTAQVSVIGILILICHSIPIEGAVAKMVGVKWRVTIALKVLGGLLFAGAVNSLYLFFDYQQQPAVLMWQGNVSDPSLTQWIEDQVIMIVSIYFIIASLIIGLGILRKLGIEKLMHMMLSPVLKLIGITKAASNITIIGLTLGMTFGAGLLISEVKNGSVSKRDVLLSIVFLSLAHSLIEDTLLILLLGADVGAILWLRIIFAVVVTMLFAKYLTKYEMLKSEAK